MSNHMQQINDLYIDNKLHRLITVSNRSIHQANTNLLIWDYYTHTMIKLLISKYQISSDITCIDLANNYLVLGLANGQLVIFKYDTLTLITSMKLYTTQAITSLKFSPNKKS